MKYKNIIEEILEVYNINASEFAEKIDVQRSNISHILSGRNNPSLDFLIKVKEVFPELRWDYILLGKKPMTLMEESNINKGKKREENERVERSEPATTSPPLQPLTLFDEIEPQETTDIKQDLTVKSTKKVNKIVWFYDDNSFEIFKG